MSMRIKLFWAMSRHIEAIRSEEDMRALKVAGAVHSKEGMEGLTKELQGPIDESIEKEFVDHVKTSKKSIERLKRLQ